ncbi:uncharacterized protein LOC134815732 isoform X1 [Bolinopsis microptera]|uniref:uncharacterized protein LOC134815732 isoform X1 n=1 Tax=Bolinopsis microptera TaxID=2820187 RepID=UPI00307B082C
MAEYEDVCELEDSVSTISVDSVTISNLAVSNNLPRGNSAQQGNSAASEHGSRQKKRVDTIPHDQMVQKLKEVEQRENEIEHVLIQNNNLMKLLLENSRESKSKVNTIKANNMEYRREMSELKGELKQKNNEIRSFSDGDKNANAQRLKIDQAAAAVKDLRDQLYEKDRVLERMKTKVEQDYSALVSENSYLKVQVAEADAFKSEHERQCDTLSTSLEENQQIIESLNDQLLGEKKLTDDYKNQLAVLSCQEAVNRNMVLESMGMDGISPGALQRRWAALTALLTPSDPGHFSRSGMESRGFEPSIGATLAASHGEQTAPPSNSPFMEYSEHRHY